MHVFKYALLIVLFAACASRPRGVDVVRPFDAERYLGTWYEIARLDHSFERGLQRVTAHYERNADGTIRVVNRGYVDTQGRWKEAVGKARPVGDGSEGRLKVSFFGPFYGAYNIVALDPEYRHALVVGSTTRYLWILSREPELPVEVRDHYLALARSIGCETDGLIWVKHDGTKESGPPR